MTLIVILNAALAIGIVGVIVALHTRAIVADSRRAWAGAPRPGAAGAGAPRPGRGWRTAARQNVNHSQLCGE